MTTMRTKAQRRGLSGKMLSVPQASGAGVKQVHERSRRSTLVVADLRKWFTAPPRAYGERDPHRVVSFLELFYDLVFVVLVGQIAHALVGHIDPTGIAAFSVTYGLIWIVWLNGSLYHDLHGREDGRSRSYIFAQMLFLVWLAVNAGHAATDDSEARGFAVVYGILIVLLARQWWLLRRFESNPDAHRAGLRWVLSTLGLGALVLVGGFVPEHARIAIWGAAVLLWIGGWVAQVLRWPTRVSASFATESSAERFGLYTILVLGEVVVGVVDGLMSTDRTPLVMLTGFLALGIGFGFWWNYFDAVGRRLPLPGRHYAVWVLVHLPLTASIAVAGAGMVSLIEHGADSHTPANVAWLLAIASASTLLWTAALVTVIDYDPTRDAIRNRIRVAYLVGALASVACGWWAPTPWLLAGTLTGIHALVWVYNFATLIWQHSSEELQAEASG